MPAGEVETSLALSNYAVYHFLLTVFVRTDHIADKSLLLIVSAENVVGTGFKNYDRPLDKIN